MLSLVLLYEGYTNRPSGQSLDQTIILPSSFKAPLYAQKQNKTKQKTKKKTSSQILRGKAEPWQTGEKSTLRPQRRCVWKTRVDFNLSISHP